jgi:hypothetical protein
MLEISNEIAELASALSKAQGEMGSAKKGADNPFFKSKYADLSEVIKALKEPFAKNGLSYTQFPVMREDAAGIVTVLMHQSGQYMRSTYTIPLVKRDAQAVGSCITYARRYALQAIAGIPAADDDGNQASEPLDPMAVHNDAVARNIDSIVCIRQALDEQNWETAAEAYGELSDDDKIALYTIAPTKGGKAWTSKQRTALKSDEFYQARKVMTGEANAG